MEENLSTTDQAETHAQPQETATVGNIRCLGDFLIFLKSFVYFRFIITDGIVVLFLTIYI